MKRKVRITRNTVLMAFGILGIAYETVVEHVDRPALLVIFGGMIGLPEFLRRDEKHDTPPSPAKGGVGDGGDDDDGQARRIPTIRGE